MATFSEINYAGLARQVMERCEELGNISQSDAYLDRRYLTAEHKKANQNVESWLKSAGMKTWQDEAGNLWGRYENRNPNAERFILGSHLDTVPNGGKYDGMLGVIAPLTLIEMYNQCGVEFPFHLDIVGFGDEEGTRFSSTLLGSRALTGQWQDEWANVEDDNGTNLRQALQDFGLDFDLVSNAEIDTDGLMGYLELHIEQGPVLEDHDLPIGIVSAIAGAKRFDFTVKGMAGHAGTVPMPLRQDALSATSEMILAIERIATEHDIVATVGRISNKPNGVNVISGLTEFSLDIRSASDEQRDIALSDIFLSLGTIASQRNVALSSRQTHSASAVHCDEKLQAILKHAIEDADYTPFTLLSGAGHDAMAIADICPVAMLFMRCDKGISHHPAEAIMESDVEVTLEVLDRALRKIGK
ncbi:allantoate amidohydrolase [Marinomonas balearica]|uniref:Allantoate deiminase n=1 Tax=Marinomonas balearica TaxID=491947 RepID=A0A4R6M7C8_9GAMM|nr:allantoate amidohydrolase [Marinomonas balearica]TDO97301.1 allantoate deiminase [Marinomonas balearica]